MQSEYNHQENDLESQPQTEVPNNSADLQEKQIALDAFSDLFQAYLPYKEADSIKSQLYFSSRETHDDTEYKIYESKVPELFEQYKSSHQNFLLTFKQNPKAGITVLIENLNTDNPSLKKFIIDFIHIYILFNIEAYFSSNVRSNYSDNLIFMAENEDQDALINTLVSFMLSINEDGTQRMEVLKMLFQLPMIHMKNYRKFYNELLGRNTKLIAGLEAIARSTRTIMYPSGPEHFFFGTIDDGLSIDRFPFGSIAFQILHTPSLFAINFLRFLPTDEAKAALYRIYDEVMKNDIGNKKKYYEEEQNEYSDNFTEEIYIRELITKIIQKFDFLTKTRVRGINRRKINKPDIES